MTSNKLYNLESLLVESFEGDVRLERLLIPRLQRGYAQGRIEEKALRTKFVSSLFEALRTGSVLELSFVYGTRSEGEFELLDGQQRLTTLFLLHLYIYLRERQELPEWLRGALCYETRSSSKDFVVRLAELQRLYTDDYPTPSVYIRSRAWYARAYRLDATVEGMLVMLDEIDEQYKKYSQECPEPLADRLGLLQFYVLRLENFGLSEDLYIKMNARGLALTPFENFKADLVDYLRPASDAGSEAQERWLSFIGDLDSKWIDLFWSRGVAGAGAETSKCYFRFFYRIAELLYVLRPQGRRSSEELVKDGDFKFFNATSEDQAKADASGKYRYLGFERHQRLYVGFVEAFGLDALGLWTHLLERWHQHQALIQGLTASWGDSLPQFFEEGYTIKQRVLFSGVVLYLLRSEAVEETELRHWMRIVWNLSENTLLDNPEKQVALWCHLDAILSSREGRIYERMAQYEVANMPTAIREEKHKASLILQDEAYEAILHEQEGHPFFRGFAAVVLSVGLSPERLKHRIQRLKPLFDKDGIVADDKEHLLLRAYVATMCGESRYVIVGKDTDGFHLKEMLRKPSFREKLLPVLDSDAPVYDGLSGYVEAELARLADDSSPRAYCYRRLLSEPKLYDWIRSKTTKRRVVELHDNGAECWLHVRSSWYDYIYLHNQRGRLLGELIEMGYTLVNEEGNVLDNNLLKNQQNNIELSGECFFWRTLYFRREEGALMLSLTTAGRYCLQYWQHHEYAPLEGCVLTEEDWLELRALLARAEESPEEIFPRAGA
ncbi:MAG: DUF262 domain-containing protein [Porphyromonas sp.]|nr:DUF262 domain-containing protein [Porphyromonas sp.]